MGRNNEQLHMVLERFEGGAMKMKEAFDWQKDPEALLEQINGGVSSLYEGLSANSTETDKDNRILYLVGQGVDLTRVSGAVKQEMQTRLSEFLEDFDGDEDLEDEIRLARQGLALLSGDKETAFALNADHTQFNPDAPAEPSEDLDEPESIKTGGETVYQIDAPVNPGYGKGKLEINDASNSDSLMDAPERPDLRANTAENAPADTDPRARSEEKVREAEERLRRADAMRAEAEARKSADQAAAQEVASRVKRDATPEMSGNTASLAGKEFGLSREQLAQTVEAITSSGQERLPAGFDTAEKLEKAAAELQSLKNDAEDYKALGFSVGRWFNNLLSTGRIRRLEAGIARASKLIEDYKYNATDVAAGNVSGADARKAMEGRDRDLGKYSKTKIR